MITKETRLKNAVVANVDVLVRLRQKFQNTGQPFHLSIYHDGYRFDMTSWLSGTFGEEDYNVRVTLNANDGNIHEEYNAADLDTLDVLHNGDCYGLAFTDALKQLNKQ